MYSLYRLCQPCKPLCSTQDEFYHLMSGVARNGYDKSFLTSNTFNLTFNKGVITVKLILKAE